MIDSSSTTISQWSKNKPFAIYFSGSLFALFWVFNGLKVITVPFSKTVKQEYNETASCPCNIIGSDCGSATEVRVPTSLAKIDHAKPQLAAELRLAGGRFGNKMFQYAAGIITSIEENLSLHLSEDQLSDEIIWPHLQNILTPSHAPNISKVVQGFFQDEVWVQRFWGFRDDICYYLSMRSVLEYSQRPKPQDIIIALRVFGASSDLYMEQTQSSPLLGESLTSPPLVYFDHVLQQHSGNEAQIWIVADDKRLRNHPTYNALVTKYGAKIHVGTVEEDFQFLSYGRNVILSPSTFYWWAVWLGSTDSERKIYYPIMPRKTFLPWCNLMPLQRLSKKTTIIYVDWYRGRIFNDQANEDNKTNEAGNSILARQACMRYYNYPANKSSVLSLYAEF